MLVLLGIHAALAAVAPWASKRLGTRVFLLCGLGPLATVVWAATKAGGVIDGTPVTETWQWLPSLGLDATLRLDAFSLLMVGLVSGIGVLIFAYADAYFSMRAGLGRFAATLVGFSGAMLGLVLADNLLLLFVFWELTSITSYLLIGFEDTKPAAKAAALQALLITGTGGLALLGGSVLLGQAAGTFTLSEILASPPSGGVVPAAMLLLLAGAFTKSAQVPFHSWLPGAMAAPTPVSAYLHSATMVKAGVYLIARLSPSFAADVGFWRPLVLTVGAATMLVGGYRALRQHDLKLVLAYGTISQLGFMVVLLGVGLEGATFAGAALLVAHGAFKSTLFMVVGIVDHQAHTRDLRVLSGLGRRLKPTFVVSALAAASMAGLPPLIGFISKESAFESILDADLGGARVLVLVAIVVGSVITFAYTARFLWGAFADKGAHELGGEPIGPDVPRPGWALLGPAAVVGVLGLAMGLFPSPISPYVSEAGRALDPLLEPHKLILWHGFNTALVLSIGTFLVGSLLFFGRRQVEALQARVPALPNADDGYRFAVSGTIRTAERVTSVLQNGSLPVYLGVIMMTVLAVPGTLLLTGTRFPTEIVVADTWLQLVVAGVVAVAAVATAWSHRRFAAVIFLGGVGFGVGVLFIIQGAPDLALTQLLVETLVLVIFVLVLRHLPERFEAQRWRLGQAPRVLVASGVGVFIAAFAMVAASVRTESPVSDAHLALSVPEAQGRNVVNVILVDFRGFDTMGEIVVLTVAALGIAGLVRAARRERAVAAGRAARVERMEREAQP
ncbi:MAG TPA: hydrogen gas-evolving membrane-bound hydrogenase subunit E [Acidimicrobiales bacterium]|nr:hydrogen gas-evolving membrane-bound hydrogenase subunit E [Acidimicrobiales bacterium]